MKVRHFLSLLDLNPAELNRVINRAIEWKELQHRPAAPTPFEGRVLGMIFEKASTRTRVSFEVGVVQMGGHALFLASGDTQMGRGEPIADTARVLSSMVDMVMIRTFVHQVVEDFATHSRVPVINALTDRFHPCQLLADMQTYRELRGAIAGKTVAWVGDGNNMCQSYINAAVQFDFELRIACPPGFEPDPQLLASGGQRVALLGDPAAAVAGAALVVTDVFASMGQEAERQQRRQQFTGYQVNAELMSKAAPDALYMHCLPAHRGEEISTELMDSPDSVIWQQAENRLHSQKALMEFLLSASQ